MPSETGATNATVAPREATDLSRLYTEGVVGGLLGATSLAVWFFFLDLLNGRPLYTPSVLGTALFHGVAGVSLADLPISFDMVVAFSWIHGLVFILIGSAASRLLGLAESNPNYGFGILLLFLVFMFGFLVAALLFAEPVLHALTWPAILVGNLLAAAAMGWYFRRRHPNLTVFP